MGTQQILLIVLSVIIVGVAIAVGITMFNSQAYNSNKTAIAADAQSFATQVLQFYKTPLSQGGAGGVAANMTDANVAGYLGFVGTGLSTENENGVYTIAADTTAGTVTITGDGKAVKDGKSPQIVTTITYASDTVTAVAGDN